MVSKLINENTMPRHWVWYLVWPILGALVMGWVYNNHRIQSYHTQVIVELQKFKNVGPRFTAQDGQELCEIVRHLAEESYGFRQSGKPLPLCEYNRTQP